MYRYTAIAVIAAVIGFFGAWKVQNWRYTSQIATIKAEHATVRQELATKLQQQEAAARQKETEWREAADKEREKNREKVRIADKRLSSTLGELRKRPERNDSVDASKMSETSASCAGVSGAELARGDGEFLARYAADAAKVNAALKHCEAQYNE